MTNTTMRESRVPAVRIIPASLILAGGIFISPSAGAAVDFSAGATIGFSHDTNVLQLSDVEASAAANGGNARDDNTKRLTANVSAKTEGTGPTQAQLQASYSHVESEQGALGHDDYTFSGNLSWKPSRAFDLTMSGSQNRLPLGLADVGGNQAVQQQTQQAQMTLRLRPTPSWQLSLAPGWSETKTPLQDADDFRLRQKTGTASIDFIGAGRMVPGVSVTQARGRYSGIADPTRYRDETIQGTLNYQATGFSTFSFAAGHTQRTTHLLEPSNDPIVLAREGTSGAFTGSASYRRTLSPKTSINLSAFRSFQQYDAGVNTSIGTGFNIGANWAATAKISVSLNTAFVLSTIEDLPVAGGGAQRKDLVRSYSLSTSYRVTQLVSVSAHVTRQIRRSEFWLDQYNGTIAGFDLTASFE